MLENILSMTNPGYTNSYPPIRRKREVPQRGRFSMAPAELTTEADHFPAEDDWLNKVLAARTTRLANSIVQLSAPPRQRLSFSLETFLMEELKSIVQYALDASAETGQENESLHNSSPAEDQEPDTFLSRITRLIELNMGEDSFNVNVLCKAMCMSRTSLHNHVKKRTGKSIGDFIRSTRLKKAADLLKNEEMNVTDVMFRVGITSPSYFTRFFKKEFGIPPSQYAKRIQVYFSFDRERHAGKEIGGHA